ITVLAFLFSKAIPIGYYLVMGTAEREGTIFAWPGVIWKAGAFCFPLCLADMVARPRQSILSGIAAACCIFLVIIDGSRTGVLVLGATVAALGLVLIWCRDVHRLLQAKTGIAACLLVVLGLFLLSAGVRNMGQGFVSTLTTISSAARLGAHPVASTGQAKASTIIAGPSQTAKTEPSEAAKAGPGETTQAESNNVISSVAGVIGSVVEPPVAARV